MEKDKQYLYDAYNATSTDDGKGEIETYENWLERQLISRISTIEKIEQEKHLLVDTLSQVLLITNVKSMNSGNCERNQKIIDDGYRLVDINKIDILKNP